MKKMVFAGIAAVILLGAAVTGPVLGYNGEDVNEGYQSYCPSPGEVSYNASDDNNCTDGQCTIRKDGQQQSTLVSTNCNGRGSGHHDGMYYGCH